MTSSVGIASAAPAAASQDEKEPIESGQAPPEPEKEPEGTEDISKVQTAKDDSRKQADDQCATAQSTSKPTSSAAVLTQDATTSLEDSTSEHDDESDDESGQSGEAAPLPPTKGCFLSRTVFHSFSLNTKNSRKL